MKKSKIRNLPFLSFRKINLKIKLILFLLVSFLKIQANPSEDQGLLTLHLEKVSVEKAFSQIEEISEYRFVFEASQIPVEKEITINIKNKKISEVLNVLFHDMNITYMIKGRQVILLKTKSIGDIDDQYASKSNPLHLKQMFQESVTGVVLDNLGQPLPGANVLEKGTTNGTQTDFDGNYSIDVPGDAILVVSYIGFKRTEVEVNDQNNINISLEEDSQQLTEVVVTALGISREKKSLGYATQQVDGEDVNNVPTDNVVNALSGKVAGVQIKTNTNLGGSSNVVIRGSTSLTGNNQALFVVDGVPVNNSNFNSDTQQSGGGGFDYGNLASDINPNDIKSMNILKGAAATALYGSRATNGAVIITTKNGSGSKNNPTVTISSSATVGFIDKSTWPKFQYEYGTGYGSFYGPDQDGYFNQSDVNGDGIQDLVSPSTAYGSYGAPFDSSLPVYQWDSFYPGSPNYLQPTPWEAPKDKLITFFETPVTLSNSVSIAGGNDNSNYRIAYTKFDQEGILPNSKISKDNIAISTSFDVNEKLTASATANYIKTDALGRNKTGNETGSNAGNVLASMRKYWAMNVGIKELKEAYFTTGSSVDPFMGGSIDNPYWSVYENYQNDTRDRIFGNVALKYKFTDWLNIEGRVSLDTYSFFQEERVNEGSAGAVGLYVRNNINFTEMNYDLMVNFNKYVTDKLNISGVMGTNIRRNDFASILAQTNGGLVLPGLYSLSNSINVPNAPEEKVEKIGVDGVYGLASFGYDSTLYLDLTGRFDHSSTLPSENSTYFYPSVSTSFIFSNLIGESEIFSFGKLRLNYAEVGSSAPANSLTDVLNKPTPYGSIPLYGVNSTKNNETLIPETTVSVEGGLELTFFKNKIHLDMSVYQTNSKDQIIPVAVSSATGYSSKFVNAGEIQNKGVEVALSGTVLSTDNFSWDVNVNWAKNRSEVLSLFEGGTNLQLGDVAGVTINATVGEPYGTIQGTDFIYVDGKRLINQATGEYERTTTSNNVIGNITPDWNGGISNSIKYKNLSLSFLIDIQKGGDVHSSDIQTGNRSGLYNYSVGLNDLGNPIRNSLADGGGIILDGVAPDGGVNAVRTAMDTYRNATGSIKAPNANFVYDASYVKLREVTLRYTLPTIGFLDKADIKSVRVGLVGSNLWIIHKNLPFSDPESGVSSGNLQGFQNGAYPTTRQVGLNVQLQF
ncbi:SusC/RagA family TonB-linked outer membrane protein [Maribacter sp. ACAM166]|uniref:SusC/RagA family TonB-linked outer membrane protein n=1 Tax=Maribacter sp. ACAM166 TaxID=2508996 RepID=UPI0010FEBB7D|nr:SusC/RagA family TonB-linked outer membrane protein [Maribacter sp. ACAM166]TLP82833.1 SusC/RagA family TonB-linked outer membrane protein [Maribacter sp. ACAM166]